MDLLALLGSPGSPYYWNRQFAFYISTTIVCTNYLTILEFWFRHHKNKNRIFHLSFRFFYILISKYVISKYFSNDPDNIK